MVEIKQNNNTLILAVAIIAASLIALILCIIW